MARKRPEVPSVESIRGGIRKGAVDQWSQNWFGSDEGTTDSGLLSEIKESGYRIDPDPGKPAVKAAQMNTTTTTNPARPRTLSAGYDPQTQVMTVVFRDGTWWNYYDVEPDMWDGFEKAESKGRYLKDSGLDSWDSMGPANVAGMNVAQRTVLNSLARNASIQQQRADGGRTDIGRNVGNQFGV